MVKKASMVVVRKKVRELDDLIQNIFVINAEDNYIPTIQNLILQEYDIELTGQVTDRRSRTNPTYYRDEFQDALLEFDFIETNNKKTKLITPETETFPWNRGRLRIIENIVEGTIGNFIEVDEEQYISMFNRRPITQPFDKSVPLKERIYLLRWTGDARRRWRDVYRNEQPVIYPFSRTPPINIFDTANKYVEENIRGWIDKAIKTAQKEIV